MNSQTTVVTIVGARPQFIKAAAVSRAFRRRNDVREYLVHTGQHYDGNMSQVFFDELAIPTPDYYLNVGSGKHGAQTGKMLESIENILSDLNPDWVMVYGDTNSTLAGALAASKLGIRLAHVEAGLRSFNRAMPEEINRVLTDHVSNLLLAPTDAAVRNLHREGIDPATIDLAGDVMYDAAIFYSTRLGDASALIDRLHLSSKKFVLSTIHRAENTDDIQRLEIIVEALRSVAKEIPIILPLHPRTRAALKRNMLLDRLEKAVTLLDPVGYLEMMALQQHAKLIVTDSGGVQKEAYFQRVPCVTLRTETEWVELVECGWNRLAPPTSNEEVASAIREVLAADHLPPIPQLYGEGTAAERIMQHFIPTATSIAA